MLTQILLAGLAASSASAASIYGTKSSYLTEKKDQSPMFPFLAGAAPYFSYPLGDNYYKINTSIPETCTLKQVQVLARHGERYPGTSEGNELIELFNTKFANLSKSELANNEYFDFLVDPTYQFFLPNNASLELLTTTKDSFTGALNPYAGELTAMKFGEEFTDKYNSLIGDTLPIFTSSNSRVYETAKYFSSIINKYLNTTINMQVLNELKKTGGNSLTPSETCDVWDFPVHQDIVDAMDTSYLDNLASRLNNATKGLNLTSKDAELLFDWCAYEIDASGYSPICNIFTQEELILHAFGDDLSSFYSDGPGNPLVKSVGSVFFNATVELLKNPPKEYNAYIGFTHDVNIQHMMAAVGLFDTGKLMDSKFDYRNTIYKKSWITPMGARVILENYECGNSSYVRYVVNDEVVPVPNCNEGPGFSCELDNFYKYAEDRLSNITAFGTACNITNLPTYQSFYWDYQTVNYTAPIEVQSY
ncbi:related to Constitutive acid phosphatase [Hanseniaspora guilliermondii]|uniref:acid phosphatase n=1 Tax=Hanseniaspora guilliermondii TaxID=56406 RepID=A0A1L0B8A6_9ASCO|nr:related to Constitutive acid phosphatase [Hanseniaspora guilliermondii]